MVKSLLVRGMLVGVVAGLLGFAVAWVYGEPTVDRAIAFEEQMAAAESAPAADAASDPAAMPGMGEEEEAPLVSREMQSTLGLLTALVLYGASFGGIFALVYAYALGRFTGVSPRGLAALLALAAYIAIVVAPDLKYAASPPASTNDDTVGPRSGLHLAMMLISVVAMVVAVLFGRSLYRKHGAWTATIAGGVLYAVVILIVHQILPEVQETPDNFPAVIFYRFRMANMGIQAVLWATIGLLFGYLTERSYQTGRAVLRPAH